MRKIAVPVNEKNELDAHFGHCKYFILADVEDKSIVKTEKVPAPPHEPGLLPKWLGEQSATDIIAGGMGQQAINLFMQNKINVFVGAPTMKASELIKKFLNEELSFTSNYCNH